MFSCFCVAAPAPAPAQRAPSRAISRDIGISRATTYHIQGSKEENIIASAASNATSFWYTNGPKQDYLPRIIDGQPTETSFDEVQEELGASHKSVLVFKFSKLTPGQTLTEHVQQQMKKSDGCVGPASEISLIYKSPLFMMTHVREATLEQARKWICPGWSTISAYQREWRAIVKNLACGNYLPVQSRGVFFGSEGKAESKGVNYTYYPILLNEPDGQWWGMLCDCSWTSDECQLEWSLRDMLTVKHSSSVTSVLTCKGGGMLWQNASSMEFYGCHGQYNTLPRSVVDVGGASRSEYNFLDLIFGPDNGPKSHQAQMRSATGKGGTFRVIIEVTDPILRSLCQLREGQEMHLDCQVTETNDPRHESFRKIFIVNQIDLTEVVLGLHKLETARKNMEAKIAKLDEMMDLIETLRWVSEVGRTAGTKGRAAQLIDSVKRQLSGVNRIVLDQPVQTLAISPVGVLAMNNNAAFLGEGSFGQVYRGKWQDLHVAVKTMMLPAEMTPGDKSQAMSLMELAVSSSLLHSNLVKTHSYSIRPIRDPLSLALTCVSSILPSSPSSFEVQIIMELCDLGSLEGASNALHPQNQPINHRAILEVAIDIAKGMLHLHSCNIIHADLKPANILLQSSPDVAKGFIAKIGDFGLSVSKDDAMSSHVSGCHGTRGHMAPEVLVDDGSLSYASDVYSYGILLFELFTGTKAFSNQNHYHFEEMVVLKAQRPSFPPGTPDGYRDLATACWSHDPANRPCFEDIVSSLKRMRAEEGGVTRPVDFKRLSLDFFAGNMLLLASIGDQSLTASSAEEPQIQRELNPSDREFWVNLYNY